MIRQWYLVFKGKLCLAQICDTENGVELFMQRGYSIACVWPRLNSETQSSH